MKQKSKILIIIAVVIVSFLGYAWFSSDKAAEQVKSIVSIGIDSADEDVRSDISEGKDIFRTLSLLKTVDLKLSFFEDPVFNSLNDFSVQLPLVKIGRSNPFEPLGEN